MQGSTAHSFTLENFSGPLELLLYLVQKSEISIETIALQDITSQYLDYIHSLDSSRVDHGAEFLATAASLLLLKSRALLPSCEIPLTAEEENDPRFEMLRQVVDYCRFKEVAKNLSQLEAQQQEYYFRGIYDEAQAQEQPSGVKHLSLNELALLLQNALNKASTRETKLIREEEWRVVDAIDLLREELSRSKRLTFESVFSPEKCREQLIVLFLAILELMKQTELCVVHEEESQTVWIVFKQAPEADAHA